MLGRILPYDLVRVRFGEAEKSLVHEITVLQEIHREKIEIISRILSTDL
jgi:hypothetical protein